MTSTPTDLQDRLDTFLADSGCPGAQLGVLTDGEIEVHAGGVLNLDTGVEATEDSVFQIGSTTKVWTATQVMQLVDDGAFDIDTPVRDLLPEFALGDEDAAAGLTVRHLLTHTSGIEGDVFDDFGTNDDCIARYVEAMAEQGTVHALDETWSYCNSGWVLLGRIIEHVSGLTWDDHLKQHVAEPLGLERFCTRPAEAILHRAAVGHVSPPDADGLEVASTYMLPRALGPAGLIITTARDLLTFGRMHLEHGRASDGEAVLSPGATARMQQVHAACPERHLLADSWGLGWMVMDRDGTTVIGHGGNTIGQSANFYLVPEHGVGVTLLTNLSGGTVEAKQLVSGLLSDLAGVTLPALPEPAEDPGPLDLDRFVGTYRRHGVETVVRRRNGHLHAQVTMSGPTVAAAGRDSTMEIDLLPGEQDADDATIFVGRNERLAGDGWVPLRFYGTTDDGRPKYLHTGARVSVRRDPA